MNALNVEQVTTLLTAYLLWGLRGAVGAGWILGLLRAFTSVREQRRKKREQAESEARDEG